MGHSVIPEAEAVLDKEFPVLDKGFVRLVDYMGSDDRIVQSARVSYGSGTKSFREDKGLINYLLRNEHTSPFEQVVFTFHTKMPIFVARQWVRHRTARVNEISGRYSVMKNEFYLPSEKDVAFQSLDNKQGRSEEEIPPELKQKVRSMLEEEQNKVYENYTALLDDNVARELARINLPLSLYTEWYWQMDLKNMFHFLKLRMDAHAQMEIRVYAEEIHKLVSLVCPVAMEAFDNHIKGSVRFSAAELDALSRVIAGEENSLKGKDLERFNAKLKDHKQL
ncbi:MULTISPECIES: FAD-dependent thymidylate synthase [unclassified Oceanispirochaeta]|uniref:FAD-dependent thymidylate synthase n=1 Tax=unclassified Oceanispirochaeta TaxID=2635722 RepID=UPI000E09723E|nr:MULTISPECIES: FAD-dependent thymidylate synthase [unclassified Oceanispirochaeta]MBF9015221.1 FAD-dependent thymidylate synthase [Oceanispirochaeta sp. M2]NPD71679.1 FAD-dependent thymidylate synthase [Oceanispirochaeta sp. M1]RDG32876.1 FAD-dependent thymidylate synthase [Oceanispirochaeta sp. M1]